MARTFAACFSVRLTKKSRCALSLSRRLLLRAARARFRPRPLGARPLDQTVALGAVLLVRLVLLARGPGPAPATYVAPAAGVLGGPMRLLADLDDAVDGAVEEGAVVRDDDDRAGQTGHEALEPVEAGEVEVVGGLVEQEHVEAREQDGGERGPRRLTADSAPISTSSRSPARPTSAHTAPARASRSSPPRARKRSSASV